MFIIGMESVPMPRPHKCRFVCGPGPLANAFKPAGIPARSLEVVELRLDELEALRLADLEGLYHDAAADQMGISRPTFGRLIASARQKVADALLNSKSLIFKGGQVTMADVRTFECADCGARFDAPYGTPRPDECPSCNSRSFHRAADERGQGRGARRRGAGGGGRGQCRRAGRQGAAAQTGAVQPDSSEQKKENAS